MSKHYNIYIIYKHIKYVIFVYQVYIFLYISLKDTTGDEKSRKISKLYFGVAECMHFVDEMVSNVNFKLATKHLSVSTL